MDDADLLQPSLSEDDDAAGFNAPWTPWSLVIASFFCGAFGGGALVAWNFRRLGQPKRWAPCLAAFLALGVALPFGVALLVQGGDLDLDDRGDKRLSRLVQQIAVVLLAMAFTRLQKRRHEIFLRDGGQSAPLLRWGVLAFVLGSLATMATLFVAFLVCGVEVGDP